jgi:hypothetical protein
VQVVVALTQQRKEVFERSTLKSLELCLHALEVGSELQARAIMKVDLVGRVNAQKV